MKALIYILLLLIFSPRLLGQEWRDSLREARKLYTEHQYEKSFRQYRSAKKLAPKEIDLSDEVAQSAYKAGKYDEAEKIYARSSSMKGSPTQKGNTHRQIGNTRMKQQKYAEAIESYKESLRSNPKDEYARYNLSEALRKLKQEQDKKQQKEKQQEKQPPKDKGGKQDQKPDQPENKDQQENQPDQSRQEKQPQDKPKQQASQSQPNQKQTQLSDKKTERMLDELMKMEMETKKKFEGVKSSGSIRKTTKDW